MPSFSLTVEELEPTSPPANIQRQLYVFNVFGISNKGNRWLFYIQLKTQTRRCDCIFLPQIKCSPSTDEDRKLKRGIDDGKGIIE